MSAPKFITPLKQTPQTSQCVLAALLLVAIALAVVAGSALAANLVKNGSFENDSNGDGMPNGWGGQDLTTADKRVCSQSFAGNCSFKMKGDASKDKFLFQVPSVSGGPGDAYTLKIWVKTKDLIFGAGLARINLFLAQTDGGQDYASVNILEGTTGWTLYTLDLLATEPYSGAWVQVQFFQMTGKAWFDKVKLVEAP